MELLPSLVLPLAILSFSLGFLFSQKHRPGSSATDQLPPGNTGWPFIGESLEFFSAGQRGSPEKFIVDRMNKYSPKVFKTSLLAESAAVFCGYLGNKFLFLNETKLVTTWLPSSVNKIFPTVNKSSATEEVKKLRYFLMQSGFFKAGVLGGYVATMDSMARQHLELHWDNKEEVMVLPLAKSYTFSLACRFFLSIQDQNLVTKLAHGFDLIVAGIMSLPLNLPWTACNRAIKAVNFIRKEVLAIIQQRRMDLLEEKGSSTTTQDILSHMVLATDENGQFMNEAEVADKMIAVLFGAYESTSAAITSIIKYLGELPHVYEEVFKEQLEIARGKRPDELLNWNDIERMKYSWNVVREALRLTPPFQAIFKVALTDFTYAGFFIPKGWKLLWSAKSTHMNSEYFPNPEKFDPSRFEGNGPAPYTYVPFGGGTRICPGKEFARIEILVFMHNVVKRFKWEKQLPNEKIVYNPMPNPTNGLPIRLYPHNKK